MRSPNTKLLEDLRTAFAGIPDTPPVQVVLLHKATNAEAEGVVGSPCCFQEPAKRQAFRSAGHREWYQRLGCGGSYRFTSVATVDARGSAICNSAGGAFDVVVPASRQVRLACNADTDVLARLLPLAERGGRLIEAMHLQVGDEPAQWRFAEPEGRWWWLLFEAAWLGAFPTLRCQRYLWRDPNHSYAYDLDMFAWFRQTQPDNQLYAGWSRRLPDAHFSELANATWACRDLCDLLLDELATVAAGPTAGVRRAARQLHSLIAWLPTTPSVESDPARCQALLDKLREVARFCQNSEGVLHWNLPEQPPVRQDVWQHLSVTVRYSALQQRRIYLGCIDRSPASDTCPPAMVIRLAMASQDLDWIHRLGGDGDPHSGRDGDAMQRISWITAGLDAALPIAGAVAGLDPQALACLVTSTFLLETLKNYVADSQQLARGDIESLVRQRLAPLQERVNLGTHVLAQLQNELVGLAAQVQDSRGDASVIASTLDDTMDRLGQVAAQAKQAGEAGRQALKKCQSLSRQVRGLRKQAKTVMKVDGRSSTGQVNVGTVQGDLHIHPR